MFSNALAFTLDKKANSAFVACVLEFMEFVAGIIFVIGSICFLPEYSKDVDLFVTGCNLFVIGSIQYVLICGLSLAESVSDSMKGWCCLQTWENIGWVVGAVIFLVGTFLYFPDRDVCTKGVADDLKDTDKPDNGTCSSLSQHMNKQSKEFWGTVLFIAGSCVFVVATFFNALKQQRYVLLHEKMAAVIYFFYLNGSLLFSMGSIAFLPHVGCGPEMVAIGAWMFIIGSGLFVIASVISFWRIYEIHKPAPDVNPASYETASG